MVLTSANTNIENLAQGYFLNCRCEGKSPKTIIIYTSVIRNFVWFCNHNAYPQQASLINSNHIRQFLWYLASETNRWGTNNPSTRKQVSLTTVNDYYRALHSFFNWLEREEFKKVALPQLAHTLKALRERLGLPFGAIDNVTVSIEQDIQKKLNAWFNQSGDSTEVSEGDKNTGSS